jgi:hypothetical protein
MNCVKYYKFLFKILYCTQMKSWFFLFCLLFLSISMSSFIQSRCFVAVQLYGGFSVFCKLLLLLLLLLINFSGKYILYVSLFLKFSVLFFFSHIYTLILMFEIGFKVFIYIMFFSSCSSL